MFKSQIYTYWLSSLGDFLSHSDVYNDEIGTTIINIFRVSVRIEYKYARSLRQCLVTNECYLCASNTYHFS